MLISPLNDHDCLEPITDVVRTLVTKPDAELLTLAQELGSTARAIRWLRSLPQRDDTGEPGDGPRVEACSPPQRLRIPAADPNCVERAALYCALGELLDPRPSRRLATIDTPVGRHTLPVEGDKPVVLDPRVPRNCAHAGVDVLAAKPAPTDLAGCSTWVCQVADDPMRRLPGGPRRLRNAQVALADAAKGMPVQPGLAEDVAMVLAMAAREAPQWGPAGIGVVERVAQAVLDLHRAVGSCGCGDQRGPEPRIRPRNALELAIGRYRLRPALPQALSAALRALGVVGAEAGAAVARAKLATIGVTPGVLGVLENELNKERLTLGALSKPAPPPHSFAALTKDALVARHLERAGDA